MSKPKWRQWKFRGVLAEDGFTDVQVVGSQWEFENWYHTIEHAAYLDLEKKLAVALDYLQRIQNNSVPGGHDQILAREAREKIETISLGSETEQKE